MRLVGQCIVAGTVKGYEVEAMARMGIAVQLAGITFAAATLLFMWKIHSPEPARMPGVSSGPDASPWFVILALALSVTGVASVRWSLAAAAMAAVAISTIAYGLISHRLVGTGLIPADMSAGVTVAIGALLAILGLWVRVATVLAGPNVARQLTLSTGGVLLVAALALMAFLIWGRYFQPTPVHLAPMLPYG
jgi:hypothetical protein